MTNSCSQIYQTFLISQESASISPFYHIEIVPSDVQKSALSVENGLSEFVRMSFGLRKDLSVFQRMDNILMGIQNKRCLVNMNEIIVLTPSVHEHIIRLVKTNPTKINLVRNFQKLETLNVFSVFPKSIVISYQLGKN